MTFWALVYFKQCRQQRALVSHSKGSTLGGDLLEREEPISIPTPTLGKLSESVQKAG